MGRKMTLPNGIKFDEDLLSSIFSWSRCSGDARYNGHYADGSESWTVLVECGEGKNRIIALGYESRDPDGNCDIGAYNEGCFIGEDAYEEACDCWGFDW